MTILGVARDAAGARAVAPLWVALQQTYPLRALAEDIARDILPEYGLAPDPAPDDLAAYLRKVAPRLLITGTSIQPGLEKQAVRLAHEMGIPSLGVLDTWTNYAARFDDLEMGEKLVYVPDMLATFDAASVDELVALGIPRARIVVTGNPNFSRLMTARPTHNPDKTRAAFDLSPDARAVLFVSEPLADEWYTQHARDYPDADEIRASLALCLQSLPPEDVLLVKLHPIEDPALAQAVLDEHPPARYRLIRRYDPLSLAAISAAVVGLNTNFLIESALAGYPTYSLHLPEYPARRSIGARFGFIPVLRSRAALRAALRGEAAPAVSPAAFPDGDAVARLVQIAEGLLSRP